MDEDLERMSRDQLVVEAKRLRAGIRAHRECSGHSYAGIIQRSGGFYRMKQIPGGLEFTPDQATSGNSWLSGSLREPLGATT